MSWSSGGGALTRGARAPARARETAGAAGTVAAEAGWLRLSRWRLCSGEAALARKQGLRLARGLTTAPLPAAPLGEAGPLGGDGGGDGGGDEGIR